MDFSSNDIRLLYGERFFLIEPDEAIVESVPPKENEQSPPKVAPQETPKATVEKLPQAEVEKEIDKAASNPPIQLLETGEAVVWKMRPTAKFVVVLQKQEFSNRELTSLLKAQLMQANIDPSWVGFGIISDVAKAVDLGSAQKDFILLFDQLGNQWPDSVESQGKKIWLVPPLTQCQHDTSAKEKVQTALHAVSQQLN